MQKTKQMTANSLAGPCQWALASRTTSWELSHATYVSGEKPIAYHLKVHNNELPMLDGKTPVIFGQTGAVHGLDLPSCSKNWRKKTVGTGAPDLVGNGFCPWFSCACDFNKSQIRPACYNDNPCFQPTPISSAQFLSWCSAKTRPNLKAHRLAPCNGS